MDTNLTKKAFLEAYKKSFGNVAQSCKAVGIVRQTYYNWLQNDNEFNKEIQDIEPKEEFLDFLESKFVERINKGDTTSIIFGLKTKGKNRGYVERQEITGADGMPNKIEIEILNKFEDTDQ